MQIESAMGGSYRDRAKERRSKFGDDIPPGDNYDNYNDDYRYFYKPAKNQTTSHNFPEFMAKKRSRGHPNPDGEIENSGKSNFEIRIPNFCYIQVIVCDLSYLPVAAVGT